MKGKYALRDLVRYNVADARANFADILAGVHYRETPVIITNYHKPRAMIVPADIGGLLTSISLEDLFGAVQGQKIGPKRTLYDVLQDLR